MSDDERAVDPVRLRGRRPRNAQHVRPHACQRDALSALLDWNNNYGDNPDKAVCFHCSNLPKHFFREGVKMDYQLIIAGTVGKENTHGTLDGTVKAGAMSFARFSTDDYAGKITGYVGEGRFTDDPLTPSAARAWSRSPTCKDCSATSARTVSSTTSRRTSPRSPHLCRRPRETISAGKCTGTSRSGHVLRRRRGHRWYTRGSSGPQWTCARFRIPRARADRLGADRLGGARPRTTGGAPRGKLSAR